MIAELLSEVMVRIMIREWYSVSFNTWKHDCRLIGENGSVEEQRALLVNLEAAHPRIFANLRVRAYPISLLADARGVEQP